MTMYTSAYPLTSPLPSSPAPRPAPEPWRFRPDVEGLRAVAILLVVGADAGVRGLHGGHVGVDVFFVISGYLLTAGLLQRLEDQRRISLRRYYAVRMIRLLPAVAVVLPVTLTAAWWWLPPTMLRSLGHDALAAALGFINYRPAGPSPVQHFWAVAVTEQVALAWPILVILASLIWLRGTASHRWTAVALGVLGIASFALCIGLGPSASPQSRAWEFAAGGLIAPAARRLVRLGVRPAVFLAFTGVVTIVLAAVFTGARTGAGWTTLWPVAGAALVVAAGCADPRRGIVRLLEKAPMRELGRLSYGWYLWHWPVLVIAPYALGRPLSPTGRLVPAALALLLASVSLVAVENRLRLVVREKLWFGPALTAVPVLAAVLALALPLPAVRAVPVAVAAPDSGLPGAARLRQLIADGAAASALPAVPRPSLGAAATDYPHDGDCLAPVGARSISYGIGMGCERRGFAGGATTVVLFGDSHAQSWYDALDVVAQQRKWRIVVLVKSNCGAPAGRIAATPDTGCDTWRDEAFLRIAELNPAMVVMSSLHHGLDPVGVDGDPDRAWAAGWLATVLRIKAIGARPVLIEDSPFPRSNVLTCLAAHPHAIQSCNPTRAAAVNTGRQRAIRTMAGANGVQVIDTTPWFCTATVCPAVVGSTLVYRDTNHITSSYSQLLGSVLGKELPG
jgi:peptidoglycan/LPS O-acetylase OafA/YrhL